MHEVELKRRPAYACCYAESMMRNWVKEFNDLPKEIRQVANAVELKERIQELKREKVRLKKQYQQGLKEINQRLKFQEKWFRDNFGADV